ncbi:hypothetical protein [Helicobacter sp. 11S03491-1]|uniref:hypothetical protein n=1 Tax=Helicobacter sp. 11S03491-1 TaxID=1476196 RepID=UPI000BA701C0|nr:hypothetical protein [Helicobacter sp. 11S03491-1]PAF42175.1 hypothetical protein BKH45_04300 [Helicobacter sp. 11S03491-1]
MHELEIFELGLALAKALGGDKEAIADVGKIASLHPEMFENLQDVIRTIKEVLKDPQIIVNNPRPKNDKDFILAKQLNEEKMGDVGIRNDEGTNIIFHVNKKRLRNLEILVEKITKGDLKIAITGRDAHTPYTPRPAGLGANVANANSASAKSILPKNPQSKPYDLQNSKPQKRR